MVEERFSLEIEYPEEMMQFFKNHHLPIWKLPVLDFGDRRGNTGYIDMLDVKDMTHPIMRFKDIYNRPGIAFHVEIRADGLVGVISINQFAIFQGYLPFLNAIQV